MADRLVILLGPPASGKGTQAHALEARFGWPAFSTGAAIRSHVERHTPFGQMVEKMLGSAYLLPDETILELIRAELAEHRGGLILDGFPRTIPQAEMFDGYCAGRGWEIDAVVAITASREELVSRILERATCSHCGGTYRVGVDGIQFGDACPRCGGTLARRKDDSVAVFHERFSEYEKLTQPLIAYYAARGIVHSFSATLPSAELTAALESLIHSLT